MAGTLRLPGSVAVLRNRESRGLLAAQPQPRGGERGAYVVGFADRVVAERVRRTVCCDTVADVQFGNLQCIAADLNDGLAALNAGNIRVESCVIDDDTLVRVPKVPPTYRFDSVGRTLLLDEMELADFLMLPFHDGVGVALLLTEREEDGDRWLFGGYSIGACHAPRVATRSLLRRLLE